MVRTDLYERFLGAGFLPGSSTFSPKESTMRFFRKNMKSVGILTTALKTMTFAQAFINDGMHPEPWMKQYGHLVVTERHVIPLSMTPFEKPVLDYHPGDAEPDFWQLSYCLMN